MVAWLNLSTWIQQKSTERGRRTGGQVHRPPLNYPPENPQGSPGCDRASTEDIEMISR